MLPEDLFPDDFRSDPDFDPDATYVHHGYIAEPRELVTANLTAAPPFDADANELAMWEHELSQPNYLDYFLEEASSIGSFPRRLPR